MSKVTVPNSLGKIKDAETFQRMASQFVDDLHPVINGKIEFDKNIRSQSVNVTFPVADQDVTVNHTLNKTDVGYIKVSQSAACSIYDGSKPTTLTTITLRSDTAGVTVNLKLV